MDFVFVARNVSKGAFGNNPGQSRFLAVPETAEDAIPGQNVTRKSWFERVIYEAETGRSPTGDVLGDVLIYIHGFNNSTRDMLTRLRLIRRGLEANGFRGVVVAFDWPSADTALAYLTDREKALDTARRLVLDAILPFVGYNQPNCRISLHVLAHSMGAFVLREAFDRADYHAAASAKGWTISQMMILSGDVSANSMGTSPESDSLYRHCVRLTNYSNPLDSILSLSEIKRAGISPRVGRVGLPPDAPSNAVNVDVGPYYSAVRDRLPGITNPDHCFYFYDPLLLRDVALTVRGAIDRASIPTRRIMAGRLVLHPEQP